MQKIFMVLLISLTLCALHTLPCRAETPENYYDIFGMEKLEPFGDIRGIFKKAAGGDISGALKMLDPRKLFIQGLKDSAGIMRSLLLICLLNGLMGAMDAGGEFKTITARILCAGLCLKVLQSLMRLLSGFADIYTAFCVTAVPLTAAVLAVSGNTVLSASTGVMYTACVGAASAVKMLIIPCISFYAVCGTVNSLAPRGMLTRLAKLIYDITVLGLRAAGMLLCAVLALQKTAAAGADGLVRKAAVSAVKAVPVAGDIFAAGADGVMAVLTNAKNGFGTAVILLLLINSLAPLANMLASAFMFRLTAALSEPLGDKNISEMIDTAGNAAMLVFSTGLCLTLMFAGGTAVLMS